MADQLKEIHTATIAVSDLTSYQYADLFTTDASTQYNITAAVVGSNTFGVDPNLEVNNFKAATLSTTAIASAIVDVSSSVRLAFPSQLTFSQSTYAAPGPSGKYTQLDDNFINGNSVNAVATTSDVDFSNYFGTAGGLLSTASDGDSFYFYSDGNSATYFYKKPSGGSATALMTNSYTPVAFDGVRYYYWYVGTTTIRRFDIETETTTDISVSGTGQASGTSYARLIYCNGYLAYFNTTSSNISIVEVSTGNRIRLTGSYSTSVHSTSTTNVRIGFWIDVDSKDVAFFSQVNTSGSIARYTLSNIGDFSSSYVNNSTALTRETDAAASYVPALNASCNICAATGLNTFTANTSNPGAEGQYEYTWGTPSAIRQVPYAYLGLSTYAVLSQSVPSVSSPTDTDFPSTISVRFSGVEVTL